MNRSSPRQRANLAANIDGCSCAPFEIERSSYMCNLIMAFTITDALSTNEFGLLDPSSRNNTLAPKPGNALLLRGMHPAGKNALHADSSLN
jgi:hypothetical protein